MEYDRSGGADEGPAAGLTKKNALAYRAAGRTDKSRILTDLVELVELRVGIATMRGRRYGPR